MPPQRPHVEYKSVVRARKPFLMGPGNDEIVPGDIVDLSDPGWGMLDRARRILIEHHWVEVVTGRVTRKPSPPPAVVIDDVLVGADHEGA